MATGGSRRALGSSSPRSARELWERYQEASRRRGEGRRSAEVVFPPAGLAPALHEASRIARGRSRESRPTARLDPLVSSPIACRCRCRGLSYVQAQRRRSAGGSTRHKAGASPTEADGSRVSSGSSRTSARDQLRSDGERDVVSCPSASLRSRRGALDSTSRRARRGVRGRLHRRGGERSSEVHRLLATW